MYFIVFDLEFNQNFSLMSSNCPFEIIQIGAIKLDSNFNTCSTFNRYVKPTIYPQINSSITSLTGITTNQLLFEETFSNIFNEYVKFISDTDSVFCIWGMSDIKVLYRNAEYHKLDKKGMPVMFINLQPYVSKFLNLPETNLISLQAAVDLLEIPKPYKFHNALYDAFYTAEILKIIYSPLIELRRYDPNYITIRPRQQKKVVDFEKLLLQFEKMYDRKLHEEEQAMIKLAYKMGKTGQFIK